MSTNPLGNQFSETVTVDTVPPSVTFLPGYGGTNDLSNPLMIINYSDPAGSDPNVTPPGLNLSTLTIMLDGIDVTSSFYISANNAVGDSSDAPTGWHTNIVSLADNIGNWTMATNVFYTTGAANTNAPVMSSFNVAGVTELPDMGEMWLQATISNTNGQYSVTVNGVPDDNWRIRSTTAGSFVALRPGTNVVVVTANDGAGNLSSALEVLVRTTRFQAAITAPGVDTFDNGSNQVISGYVSAFKDAGLPTQEPLSSVPVNGIATTWVTNGDGTIQFTTVSAVPVPGDGTLLSLNVQIIWPDINTFSLGLMEGYMVKHKEETYAYANSRFEEYSDTNATCQGDKPWLIDYDAKTLWSEVFVDPDSYGASNETDLAETLNDTNTCTAGTDPSQLQYGSVLSSTTTYRSLSEPSTLLAMNMGTMTETSGDVITDSGNSDNNWTGFEMYWQNDTSSMTVHWPMQYKSNQVVLLTFTDVDLLIGVGWTNGAVDGTQILYLGQPPVVVVTNSLRSFNLSYIATVTSDTFTIDGNSFSWPSLSYNPDFTECYTNGNGESGSTCITTDDGGNAHHISFGDFHNSSLPVTVSPSNFQYCVGTTNTFTASGAPTNRLYSWSSNAGKVVSTNGSQHEVVVVVFTNCTSTATVTASFTNINNGINSGMATGIVSETKIEFYDQPRRYASQWPWTFEATLEAVCVSGIDNTSTNFSIIRTSLASITYGFTVLASGVVTNPYCSGAGQSGDFNNIVVYEFERHNGYSGGSTGISGAASVRIRAYYIGCCNNGQMNWVQTLTKDTPHTYSYETIPWPDCDYDLVPSQCPYYYPWPPVLPSWPPYIPSISQQTTIICP